MSCDFLRQNVEQSLLLHKRPNQVPVTRRPFLTRRNELMVEEGCLLWGFRVVIPQSLRQKLLQELHKDHPGVTRMKSVARSYMWWPGLDKDIEKLAKSCTACLAMKRAQFHFTLGSDHPSPGNASTWTLQVHFKEPCT